MLSFQWCVNQQINTLSQMFADYSLVRDDVGGLLCEDETIERVNWLEYTHRDMTKQHAYLLYYSISVSHIS